MVLSKAVWKMDLQEHLIHQQCRCQGCPTEPCSPGTPRALSRCCLGPCSRLTGACEAWRNLPLFALYSPSDRGGVSVVHMNWDMPG